MKKIIVTFLLLWCTTSFAQIKWLTIEQAVEAQKTNPKKILIDFYADWCGPCKIMDKSTFGNPIISDYINTNYYPVKFNSEEKKSIALYGRTFSNENKKQSKGRNSLHEFTQYMNINAVPSTVFLDENTAPITILQGALSAKDLEPYLIFFAENKYLKIKTREEWEEYLRKFKSKIIE